MVQQPYDTPTEATAERGEVMIDGPNGVAVSLTPAAAQKSAESIAAAADQARKQIMPERETG